MPTALAWFYIRITHHTLAALPLQVISSPEWFSDNLLEVFLVWQEAKGRLRVSSHLSL